MQSTLETSATISRRPKSRAVKRGDPLPQFASDAVQGKLKAVHASGRKPWMKHFGKLKDLHKENKRIDRLIEQAFEEVEPYSG